MCTVLNEQKYFSSIAQCEDGGDVLLLWQAKEWSCRTMTKHLKGVQPPDYTHGTITKLD